MTQKVLNEGFPLSGSGYNAEGDVGPTVFLLESLEKSFRAVILR